MSELSEAIERAQKRLDKMTEQERFKYHVSVLREELERGRAAIAMAPRQRRQTEICRSLRTAKRGLKASHSNTPNTHSEAPDNG